LLEPLKEIGLGAVDGKACVNGRLYALQGASLHVPVGLDVYVKGLQVSVTQDVFDGDRLDASLKQMHGLGVTTMSLKT
jgi:hypothetical protein